MYGFMPFEFKPLAISDVVLINPTEHNDERGYFLETYKKTEFKKNGINANFVQDNFSFSLGGVIRGLHYQKPPHAQGKLVSVVKGSIFDVAVDLRANSPTFGKWVSASLTSGAHDSLWIPEGFAHGFQALEDSYVVYKVTSEYNKSAETGLIWNDSYLKIKWPAIDKSFSKKDSLLPTLKEQTYLFQ